MNVIKGIHRKKGSALIMAVVVSVLLAVVGVMFLVASRLDKTATTAVSDLKQLDLAVQSVVAMISQKLADDIGKYYAPDANAEDYKDYPDKYDSWLASIEPYRADPNYYWRQISDINDRFGNQRSMVENVPAYYVRSDEVIDPNYTRSQLADADGDGIGDSRWVRLGSVDSQRPEDIFFAVRVIDNGGMLNINTGYKFEPNSPVQSEIDGSRLYQIDLTSLTGRGPDFDDPNNYNSLGHLLVARAGAEANDVNNPGHIYRYEHDVTWGNRPNFYTPFDIGDELELRYRFIIDNENIHTRLEEWFDEATYPENSAVHRFPYKAGELDDWKQAVYLNSTGNIDQRYNYRHITTTLSSDRPLAPRTGFMRIQRNVNANSTDANSIKTALLNAARDYDGNSLLPDYMPAQIAANMKDYIDSDCNMTYFTSDGDKIFGFERPIIYISELYHIFESYDFAAHGVGGRGWPWHIFRSYAIELHKALDVNDPVENWRLRIIDPIGSDRIVQLSNNDFNVPGGRYCVLTWEENASAAIGVDVSINAAGKIYTLLDSNETIFTSNSEILLERAAIDSNGTAHWAVVDYVKLSGFYGQNNFLVEPPPASDGVIIEAALNRNMGDNRWILRNWQTASGSHTLGNITSWDILLDPNTTDPNDPNFGLRLLKADVRNGLLNNIGEIGMVFKNPVYFDWDAHQNPYNISPIDRRPVGYGSEVDEEIEVRFNLQDPQYQNVFNYLTVWPRGMAGPVYPSIHGRININTAPWYVIAQLPWVSQRKEWSGREYQLAKAIVAYRDKEQYGSVDYNNRSIVIDPNGNTDMRENLGFASIGELMNVINNGSDANDRKADIRYYSLDGGDMTQFPELVNQGDGVADDFEERDVIFHRISDLTTVRSDIFTAYIVCRLGVDGTQRRYIAILDRSGCSGRNSPVQVLALHPVEEWYK